MTDAERKRNTEMCAVIVDPPQSIPHNAAAGVAEGVSSLCVFPQCRATHQDCLVVRATKATVAMHLKTRARPLQIDDQGEHRKRLHSVFFFLLHHFTTLLLLFASTTAELTTTTTCRNPLEEVHSEEVRRSFSLTHTLTLDGNFSLFLSLTATNNNNKTGCPHCVFTVLHRCCGLSG